MNFGDGYDYEEVENAYTTGRDDGGEQGYNIGYKEGYQDGIRVAGGTKADIKTATSDWVRTADRVPTKADANKWGNVATVFYYTTGEARVVTWPWDLTAQEPENYPYWMPFPKPPEGGV